MQIPREILILLCSIGAVQSFFLAYTFINSKNKSSFISYILSALFFFVGLRVAKSVLWAFWDGTPNWLINFGFAAHLTVGPLLLLYIFYSINSNTSFPKFNYLHFIPAFLVLLFSFQLTLNSFWYEYGYSILLYHQLIYSLSAGIYLFIKTKRIDGKEIDTTKLKWLRNLWLGIFIWNLAYFSNYILGFTSYFLGPVLYSVIVYIISYFVYKNQGIFEERLSSAKYKNINLSEEDIRKYIDKIISKIEKEELFLDPNFSLNKLSHEVNISNYLISHVLNIKLGKNFSEFINSYRIDKAKRLMSEQNTKNHKIANIAYDCGFNSISAFNAAFKRIAKTTPSEFKSKLNSK